MRKMKVRFVGMLIAALFLVTLVGASASVDVLSPLFSIKL